MGQAIIGLDATAVALATDVPAFRLGTVGGFDDPVKGYQEFIYGKAGGAFTGLGYLGVEYGSTGQFAQVTTANSGFGNRVAAAQAALLINQFGWFQVYGRGTLRTLASAALNARLNTTATSGAVDDDGAVTSKAIFGVSLLTSSGGAAESNTSAIFSYPTTGTVL